MVICFICEERLWCCVCYDPQSHNFCAAFVVLLCEVDVLITIYFNECGCQRILWLAVIMFYALNLQVKEAGS